MKKKTIKVFKILGICIISIFVVFLIGRTIKYFSLRKDSMRTLDTKIEVTLNSDVSQIDLVGLIDSYAVPYSPSVDKSFMDLLRENLSQQNKLGDYLDLFNLYINKTWEVNGIFNNDITFEEFNILKTFSIDFTRHKYGDKIVKNGLEYTASEEYSNTGINDYYAQLKNPCVVYSCSANDLFYYFGVSLESLTFSKCIELIRYFDEGLDTLCSGIESNINTLNYYNDRSQIFVLGLYLPSDNFFLQTLCSGIVDKINKRIETICDLYSNCYYVDVSGVCFHVLDGDFHPDADGQYIIAEKLAESISKNYKYGDFVEKKDIIVECSKTDYTNETISAEKVIEHIKEKDLKRVDYVEWSVAIEDAFYNLYPEGVTYKQIEQIKYDLILGVDEAEKNDVEKALQVMIAERKILNNIDESVHSLYPETKKNDKLGLISYYN